MNPIDKPMLTPTQQVEHMKSKGILFDIMSEAEAIKYLTENNNYFKLRAYRKNFDKYVGGKNDGKYISLDFAMLKDLSIIDMHLRYLLIQMALDTEHFLKVKLLHRIENSGNNGYQIIDDYFLKLQNDDTTNGTRRYDHLMDELVRNQGNPYCGGIIAACQDGYSAWAFVEVVALGTLLSFYSFCADCFNDKEMRVDYMLMKDIQQLRNASAHSNCILYDMKAQDRMHSVNYNLMKAIHSIPKATRKKRFSNERMRQLCTLIYAHYMLVSSPEVHMHVSAELHNLITRMYRHSDYYTKTPLISACFGFFEKVVNIFF